MAVPNLADFAIEVKIHSNPAHGLLDGPSKVITCPITTLLGPQHRHLPPSLLKPHMVDFPTLAAAIGRQCGWRLTPGTFELGYLYTHPHSHFGPSYVKVQSNITFSVAIELLYDAAKNDTGRTLSFHLWRSRPSEPVFSCSRIGPYEGIQR